VIVNRESAYFSYIFEKCENSSFLSRERDKTASLEYHEYFSEHGYRVEQPIAGVAVHAYWP
jgi:hypothetical protein